LKSEGHIVDFVVADIASSSIIGSSSPCKYAVEMATQILGGLTAVVNAAGVLQAGAADAVTVDNYDYNMNTNARASFEIMTHAIPYLKEAAASAPSSERKGDAQFTYSVSPSIINISSVNGKQSFPGCISYCMSKAAVDMMTRCASVDLAKYGIRVNSVNPGMVVTNLQKVCALVPFLFWHMSGERFRHLVST
jgi:NAD(P)-dependent dehydrogenase (short-subunit alcohol dehydrogenase family)